MLESAEKRRAEFSRILFIERTLENSERAQEESKIGVLLDTETKITGPLIR